MGIKHGLKILTKFLQNFKIEFSVYKIKAKAMYLKSMKIAIDGPSASGKGTISKILAKKIPAFYLNTGKIYRIIALLASQKTGDIIKNAIELSKNVEKHFIEQSDNTDIYTEENAKITSQIAVLPEIRSALLEFQQNFAKNGENVILEGRDIGTVVMPDADFKFYLDASPEERAKRRMLQLGTDNPELYQKTLNDIVARDKNDMERKIAALTIAKDAIYIDTTFKSIDDVIEIMLQILLKQK